MPDTISPAPEWQPTTEEEIWRTKKWMPAFDKEYDSKVRPHLSRNWLEEGLHLFWWEYITVISGGAEFYLEITPDENGLPILPERAFWKLYTGD